MLIYRDLDSIPEDISTVLSVGKFDGIHMGHQSVLRAVKDQGLALGVTSAVVTFDPLPSTVLHTGSRITVLTPLPLKLTLLERLGLDVAVVLPFTTEFASCSPEEFVRDVLVEKLHVRQIHEGSNFHFGKSATAGTDKLLEMGNKYGFGVHIHRPVRCGDHAVSSSLIRALVTNGSFELADLMLAWPAVTEFQAV